MDDYYYGGEEEISVGGFIEEQRRLSVSQNPFERVVGSLCAAGMRKKRLVALPDTMIGRLMFT